jgi:hypothetical protein
MATGFGGTSEPRTGRSRAIAEHLVDSSSAIHSLYQELLVTPGN